ncbi:unnamed protein product [Aspergillus oryzae RIB40]|uniref:DNA, SC012 n=1 Tax=Aspergillus oryzae (strain ATCC 42149 / RIB 40) TaxID=510516 RepID=Q2UC52_ASPOR|nr:unnamed protein product [Aspergillus oryzae RIB40]BAE60863.1 unnamed protein product [Aspergillus oryzae RIB40]
MSPRSIVITASLILRSGGASGIGLGITRHFISQPETHITILDINPKTGSETLQELQAEHPSASISFEECDVSSWESQAAVFEKIYAEQGRIDIVFANAGITEKGSLLPAKHDGNEGPPKPNLATLSVNLVGAIYTSSNGLIVCTASNAGLYPFPMAPMYATTKAGVVNLVRSLARPLVAEKIRINALAPAVIVNMVSRKSKGFRNSSGCGDGGCGEVSNLGSVSAVMDSGRFEVTVHSSKVGNVSWRVVRCETCCHLHDSGGRVRGKR